MCLCRNCKSSKEIVEQSETLFEMGAIMQSFPEDRGDDGESRVSGIEKDAMD